MTRMRRGESVVDGPAPEKISHRHGTDRGQRIGTSDTVARLCGTVTRDMSAPPLSARGRAVLDDARRGGADDPGVAFLEVHRVGDATPPLSAEQRSHPPFLFLLDEEGPDLDVLAAVRDLIGWTRTVEAPRFGSREWLELGRDDPRWKAALVLAAAAWWAADNDLGLPASRERIDQAVAVELKDASLAVHQAMAEQGEFRRAHTPNRVLAARRALPATRPGDHPGGPVPAWGPDGGGRVA